MTEADKAVSHITKQVSSKKIQISLHRLLEIVKPEIQQDIINSIANPNISRINRTPFEAKRKCKARKKLIFNNTASESSSSSSSSSSSESESDSGSSNDDKDFTVGVVDESHCSVIKAKKCG